MNNEEIIEEVLREKNLEDDSRLIWALVNSGYCKTIVEASEEVDHNKEKILKKALAIKDAEHLEFLKRINQFSKENLFGNYNVIVYGIYDRIKQTIDLIQKEISRLEGEGK